MRCPCCPIVMKSGEMFQHVWQEHRLLLDGDRARQPWDLLAQRIREYREGSHGTPLARCQALGQQLDARWGVARVECILHEGESSPGESQVALVGEAAAVRASLCPRCYGRVFKPLEHDPYAVSLAHGRLSAHGYQVDISEFGLVPRLTIETPGEVLSRGREPGYGLTQRGGWLLLNGPLVVAAILLAMGIPDLGIRPIWPVLLFFAMAVAVHWLIRRSVRSRRDPNARALENAWRSLVPALQRGDFSREDSSLVAGLALATVNAGTISVDKEELQRHLELTERAALSGAGVMRHAGALWRLALHQRARQGLDLGQMVAGQLQRCFEGPLSLAFAEGLLVDWQPETWTAGERARIRVLLCERAFEAGFEVADLIEAGEDAPSLGRLIGKDIHALVQLRLLWSLRPNRPWDRFGSALSAFEVAEQYDAVRIFTAYPDLLLWAELPAVPSILGNGMQSSEARVALCARGVCFQEEVFTEFPRTIEVVSRTSSHHGRHELLLGDRRFPFEGNPGPVAAQLERWLRYYFGEFRAQVPDVGRWQPPDLAAIWKSRGSVICPDCGSVLLPRVGEVGLSLEAYERARSGQEKSAERSGTRKMGPPSGKH